MYRLPWTSTAATSFWPATTLYGTRLVSSWHLAHLAAHEPLDGEDGVLRVRDCLALGDLADEALAVLREADDRRGRATAFGVGDDDRDRRLP